MAEALFIEKIQKGAEEAMEIPLWGSPPAFPIEDFCEKLTTHFEAKQLKIEIEKSQWLPKEKLTNGFGKAPMIQPLALSPLPGSHYLIIPAILEEVLLNHFLQNTGKIPANSILKEGLFAYLMTCAMHTLNQINPYGNVVVTFADESPLPEEGGLAIDLSLTLGSESIPFRLIAPEESRRSFAAHFSMQKPPLLSNKRLASLPAPLQLSIGSTTITAEEWQSVSVGDFVSLDRCTYSIEEERGTAILSIGRTPLFDVRIKEGQVKLLEYALVQEESMTEENSQTQEEEKPLPADQIPISISVEVAHMTMPLEKVAQLKPGNLLDLGVPSKPDVHLVTGGKRIAKGELVSLGETLGVKILKLGE